MICCVFLVLLVLDDGRCWKCVLELPSILRTAGLRSGTWGSISGSHHDGSQRPD